MELPETIGRKRIRITPTVRRNADGRFAPGTAPGPGRPAGTAEYREAVVAAVSPLEVARVIRVVLREALKGRAWACALLLDRLVGRVARAEESGPDSWQYDPEETYL